MSLGQKLRAFFPELSEQTLSQLDTICEVVSYPGKRRLFEAGEESRGLFILLSGSAKLIARSDEGRGFVLRSVKPGETMGASSAIGKVPYLMTAQIAEPSQVALIRNAALVRLLSTHPQVPLWLISQVSLELERVLLQTRLLALAPNATTRLAYFLLLWAREQGQQTSTGVRIPLSMTQEELGEIICATRETVNHVLADLQRRGLVRVESRSILLRRIPQLRALVSADFPTVA